MEPLFLAAAVSVMCYLIIIAVLPKSFLMRSGAYTQHVLDRLAQVGGAAMAPDGVTPDAILRDGKGHPGPLSRAFFLLFGADRVLPLLGRAGMANKLDTFLACMVLVFIALTFMFARFGAKGLALAAVLSVLSGWLYLRHRVKKRQRIFMDGFPDALDMIVRSIRSGYPLSAAISMVAENMLPPISTEFKRVADETAYGWTLVESLQRLADRVDEADVRFFIVVLSVQQESGGNLSEVLTNLSSIIRKRKQLRLKIRALSSEGRATAWILGSLPFFLFLVLSYTSPKYLDPLYYTSLGNMILASVVGLVALGMLVVKQIINMDV